MLSFCALLSLYHCQMSDPIPSCLNATQNRMNEDCSSRLCGFKYKIWNNATICCPLTFSTHACCDNRLADQEKGKIPGREGSLVKRICNSRTYTHAQTSLRSMHTAVGMNACSCAGTHAHTQTHDCTQQAFDRQQHTGGGQVQPLSNLQ